MGTVELERLQISTANTHYDLRFNRFRAIQIVGDSGTGKTMLGTIVRALGNELEFGNRKALVVDTLHTEGITEIRLNHSDYSLIILDNADLEYTNEVLDIMRNDILSKESNTYWVVIGRKVLSNSISISIRCELYYSKGEQDQLIVKTSLLGIEASR